LGDALPSFLTLLDLLREAAFFGEPDLDFDGLRDLEWDLLLDLLAEGDRDLLLCLLLGERDRERDRLCLLLGERDRERDLLRLLLLL